MVKTAVACLCVIALAAAIPKPATPHFRNLFKPPVNGIKTKVNPKIIGGHEAEPHSIPYQAFLEIYTIYEGWYCGGSLISTTYILTAGHCGDGAVEAHVTLGAHKPLQSEDSQTVLISKYIKVHEKYDSTKITNDVAVVKLPEAVTLSKIIKPVALPTRSDAANTYKDATGRISGWGLTNGFGADLSDVLNYVDVKVISNQDCEVPFGSLVDSVICTSGDGETGSCSGDSGGPLVINGVQVGVVSFGIIYCLPGYPSAFSRVTSFLDWIQSNTDVVIR